MRCRYTVEISINSKLAKGDMTWLEQQFEMRGFTLQVASMSLHCHVADFQSAFPQVSYLQLHLNLRQNL